MAEQDPNQVEREKTTKTEEQVTEKSKPAPPEQAPDRKPDQPTR